MYCPVCQVPLKMTERYGIEVDYCPSCRGVWLDRGELDKIIERASHVADAPDAIYRRDTPKKKRGHPDEGPVARRYDDDDERYDEGRRYRDEGYDDDDYRPRKWRKKGRTRDFLEDIFDIFD